MVAAHKQDDSKLYSHLEYELKTRKNLSATTHLQELTLTKRSVMDKIKVADVTKKILEKFLFRVVSIPTLQGKAT